MQSVPVRLVLRQYEIDVNLRRACYAFDVERAFVAEVVVVANQRFVSAAR